MSQVQVKGSPPLRWYNGLNGYHWLIIAVASMGWMFDTMDQWLFVQVKTPAIAELLSLPQADPLVKIWVGRVTTIFILGWATGGLFFGMVGDRLGRTTTMGLAILIYAVFTGACSIVHTPMQFAIALFCTGLGIGGEFAAGAALVAETLPAHARPTALAIVQAMSAIGNVMAAMINFFIGSNPNWGWRPVFAVGILPALLLVVIFFYLKEPQAWIDSRERIKQGLEKRTAFPVFDLFREPILRRNTFVGLFLGAVGVVGFWGIGTWSSELFRSVFNPNADATLKTFAEQRVALCVAAQNLGGFFGVLAFSSLTQKMGRRQAFAISLITCAVIVPVAFRFSTSFGTAALLFAVMGFCLLSMFGGYAIYFPELFPTRLRSTGTGFCYNVARYISASGPIVMGLLSSKYGIPNAALILSGVFVLGLLILPFAPETKGKPLME